MQEITKYKAVVVSNAIILKQSTEKICHLTQKFKYHKHTHTHTHLSHIQIKQKHKNNNKPAHKTRTNQ